MKKAYGEPKNLKGKTKELIMSIDEIVNAYALSGMKITVRQIYYQLVAKNIIENNKRQYDRISEIISDGRMAGLLD